MSYSFLTSPENDSVLKEVLALKDAGHTGEVTIFMAQGGGDEGYVETELIDEESSLYEILSECLEDGWEVHGAGSSGHFKVDFDNEVICTSFYYWGGTGDFEYARKADEHKYDLAGELIYARDVRGEEECECNFSNEIRDALSESNILKETQAFINGLSWDKNSSIETIYALATKVYEHLTALMEHAMGCISSFEYVKCDYEEDEEELSDVIHDNFIHYYKTGDSLICLLSDLLLILVNESKITNSGNDNRLLSLLNKMESFKNNPIWDSEWESVTELLFWETQWLDKIDENIEDWKKNIVS